MHDHSPTSGASYGANRPSKPRPRTGPVIRDLPTAYQLARTIDDAAAVLMDLSELLRDTQRETPHKLVTGTRIDHQLHRLRRAGDPLDVEPRLRRLLLAASPPSG